MYSSVVGGSSSSSFGMKFMTYGLWLMAMALVCCVPMCSENVFSFSDRGQTVRSDYNPCKK